MRCGDWPPCTWSSRSSCAPRPWKKRQARERRLLCNCAGASRPPIACPKPWVSLCARSVSSRSPDQRRACSRSSTGRRGMRRRPAGCSPGPPGEAQRELRQAAANLAETAARYGARIQRTDWQLAAGYLHLHLDLAGADGMILPLRLQTRQIPAGPAKVVRRPAPPVNRPPIRRPEPRPSPVPKPEPKPRPGPRVAIILDDVGELAGTEEFLALPAQLTIAVLPLRRYSETYARQAGAAGRTVLLHLPLEATGGSIPGRAPSEPAGRRNRFRRNSWRTWPPSRAPPAQTTTWAPWARPTRP